MCTFWEWLTDTAGTGQEEQGDRTCDRPLLERQAHSPQNYQCQDSEAKEGMQGGRTSKPLLEEPGGQAIGHTQVIQALCRPLIQLEEQRRQVLPGIHNLFQQADGLE